MARNELMAEEVLEKFSRAVAQNAITLREAKTSSDLYYFSDQPDSKPRFTYALLSKSNQKEVVAVAVIALSTMHSNDASSWGITWVVNPNFRNQGFGKSIAKKSLEDFLFNVKDKLPKFSIEAAVDSNNIASRKIGMEVLGNEEIIMVDGAKVFSYMKIYP